MAFAQPVSRGCFHYNGCLYVEVGNLNRHKRATVEEISALLRPDLKRKTASLDPPKDQVGHWYEAQLVHYGLSPSKDKARAKMRLLEALNSSGLVVPPNIIHMEAEMKKEYAAAERKAKAQHKAAQSSAKKSEPLAVGRKRKQPETSANVNNNATSSSYQAKKAKTALSKPNKKKTDDVAPPKPSKKTAALGIEQPLPQAKSVRERPKQTARASHLTAAWLNDPSLGPGPINPATGVSYVHPSLADANTAEWEIYRGNWPAAEEKAAVNQDSKFKKEEKIKKELGVKKEPGSKSSSNIKNEPNSPSLGLINGLYDLSCPTVESEWSCSDLTLTLTLDGTTMWGAYDLGTFSGIIFLPDRPWQASDESLPFTWRGRENGEGEMSFGTGCEGEISFLGKGFIKGWISVYGRCHFEGFRRHEAGTAVRPAKSMRAEWDGYNERAYEEERVGRWG